MAGAALKLTKQAAVHRLIMSAVRLCSAADDALAAHLVAASALELLRGLVRQKGGGYVSETLAIGFFEMAQGRLAGRGDVPQAPEFEPMLEQIIEGIRAGKIRSPKDIDVQMTRAEEEAFVRHIKEPANFLKHADRDPKDMIDLAEVNPVDATVHAITAYSILFPTQPLPEPVRSFLEEHVGLGD